jgi:hypothetical protein
LAFGAEEIDAAETASGAGITKLFPHPEHFALRPANDAETENRLPHPEHE